MFKMTITGSHHRVMDRTSTETGRTVSMTRIWRYIWHTRG